MSEPRLGQHGTLRTLGCRSHRDRRSRQSLATPPTRFFSSLLAAAVAALLQISGCTGSAPARIPPPSPTPVPPTPIPATPTPVPDLFATVIRPAVRAHCSPCHEPGGRMYSRLPFDDPKVLISHSEGVLRRLQGDNRESFQRWIATVNPEN